MIAANAASTSTTATATTATEAALGNRNRLVLSLLLISTFIVILNESIMGVALPRLMIDLAITASAALLHARSNTSRAPVSFAAFAGCLLFGLVAFTAAARSHGPSWTAARTLAALWL